MRVPWLVCALPACFAAAAAPAAPPALEQIRARIAEALSRLPDYTCSETIRRSRRNIRLPRFRDRDTVRLEVAYIGGRELFAYPGADEIAEPEVSRLVPDGPIGDGHFALLVRSIFFNPAARFTFQGETTWQGRRALKFDYAVPLASSQYRLRVPHKEAAVAYHGCIYADALTFELMRLETAADRIPRSLGINAASSTTDYASVTIGGTAFLLPRTTILDMTDAGGNETRNVTGFHSCHQFKGESVLSFEDPADTAAAPAPRRIVALELPRDFSARLSLLTPVDSETAAVGDAVDFELVRDLKHGRQLIAPKRAVFHGRIISLSGDDGMFAIGFRLDSVRFDNFRADLTARNNTFSLDRDGFPSREGRVAGLITVFTDHLRWPKGFQLGLHSRQD